MFVLMVLSVEAHASRILQHADASNGHITIEEIAASWSLTHKWYVFHFGGMPVAVRSQVQIWANNRRAYYRANFANYLSEWAIQSIQNNPWNLQFRWYFVAKDISGAILDSGFLYNNNQIVWDGSAQFMSPADNALIVSHNRHYGLNQPGLNILVLDESASNRRELAQRWINTQRRNTVTGSGEFEWVRRGQNILIRDGNTGVITDLGFFNNTRDSDVSDLTAPIIWLE